MPGVLTSERKMETMKITDKNIFYRIAFIIEDADDMPTEFNLCDMIGRIALIVLLSPIWICLLIIFGVPLFLSEVISESRFGKWCSAKNKTFEEWLGASKLNHFLVNLKKTKCPKVTVTKTKP